MAINEYTIPLLLSSSTATGAYNVTTGRDRYDIALDQEIDIPAAAKRVTVEVESASVWYVQYNISAALQNNRFYLDVSGDAIYEVELADGLYDLSALAHAINVSLVNQGLASDIITFTADPSTQRVIINFSRAGLRADFTQTNTCRSILGFNAALRPTAYTTAVASVYGDSTAQFNALDYYLIHSDIVSGGISINGKRNSTVARILINTAPGSQIIYAPPNPIRIQSDNLIGRRITNVHSWITDQDNRTLNFNGEEWSYSLLIRYYM